VNVPSVMANNQFQYQGDILSDKHFRPC